MYRRLSSLRSPCQSPIWEVIPSDLMINIPQVGQPECTVRALSRLFFCLAILTISRNSSILRRVSDGLTLAVRFNSRCQRVYYPSRQRRLNDFEFAELN